MKANKELRDTKKGINGNKSGINGSKDGRHNFQSIER